MRSQLRFSALASLLVALLVVAACASSATAPPPTEAPPGTAAPTAPAGPTITSPEDAAALVVASDPRFEGAMPLDPQMIGASRWWEAAANDDGTYSVKVTLGWGDCPAGCINRHTWTYRVGGDGGLTLVEEAGDPVPASFTP